MTVFLKKKKKQSQKNSHKKNIPASCQVRTMVCLQDWELGMFRSS